MGQMAIMVMMPGLGHGGSIRRNERGEGQADGNQSR
jgi:hypothetical protein